MNAVRSSLLVLTLAASGAWAQNPPAARPMGPDSGPPPMWAPGPRGPGMQGERMQMLRQQIEERFGQMVQQRLQLNDAQMQQLRTAMRANQDRRRDLMRRQMDIQRAIGDQMKPGIAANADSLNRLLNASGQVRVDMAQSDQLFMRDLSFMTPVQRAQLMMMTRNFEERIQQIRMRGMRGGAGPMMDGQPGDPGQPGQPQGQGQGRRRPR